MSENKGRTYETPRILTHAELILLEILKSQLKIEKARGGYGANEWNTDSRSCAQDDVIGEIERQIEELTKPITRTLPEPF